MTNVPCPCCGYLTLSARSRFEICPVCRWEDDGQDDADAHEVKGGPNGTLSLTEGRANFAACGAADPRHVQKTRRPRGDELRGALTHGVKPRQRVAAALRAAAVAHERGAFGDIGPLHDQLEGMSLEPVDQDVTVAINFLDGWCDSSNHNWSYYEPLVAADWPALALRLAADLESGTPIADAVREQFEFRPSRGPLAWVRGMFRRSPRHQASRQKNVVPLHRRYISWERDELHDLPVGLSRIVTEIDQNGRVLREVGLDAQGEVVHHAPSEADNYGLFDLVPVDAGPDSDIRVEVFESWWQSALDPPAR
jgi:hypothetical protein